jgi:hypothetical protein
LNSAVFYNTNPVHYLLQFPVIGLYKKEEQVLIFEPHYGVLSLIRADISFVELYAGGIAVKNGQGVEPVFAFVAFQLSNAVVPEKIHLLGAVHCLT